VEVSLLLVEEMSLHNSLPKPILSDPTKLDWGFAEIARVVIEDDSRSELYLAAQVPFHHLTVKREHQDWINVVFSEMIITETEAPPRAE
jgi:hypothetical protein